MKELRLREADALSEAQGWRDRLEAQQSDAEHRLDAAREEVSELQAQASVIGVRCLCCVWLSVLQRFEGVFRVLSVCVSACLPLVLSPLACSVGESVSCSLWTGFISGGFSWLLNVCWLLGVSSRARPLATKKRSPFCLPCGGGTCPFPISL